MNDLKLEQEQSLLEVPHAWTSDRDRLDRTARSKRWRPLIALAWILQLSVLVWLATVMTLQLKRSSVDHHLDSSWSPAQDAFEMETRRSWQRGPDPLVHGTEDEIHAAWEKLQAGKNVKVTAEELIKSNNELEHTVEATDGSYVGILGVYHSIHCLSLLRALVRDQGNRTVEPLTGHALKHSYHCISFLVDAVTCKADLTLYRAEWIKNYHEPDNKAVQSNSMVQCTNWDRIDKWATQRALADGQFYVKADPIPLNETRYVGGDE